MVLFEVEFQHPTTLEKKKFKTERTLNWTNATKRGTRFTVKI